MVKIESKNKIWVVTGKTWKDTYDRYILHNDKDKATEIGMESLRSVEPQIKHSITQPLPVENIKPEVLSDLLEGQNSLDKKSILTFMTQRLEALENRITNDFNGGLHSDHASYREIKWWKEAIERGEFDLK